MLLVLPEVLRSVLEVPGRVSGEELDGPFGAWTSPAPLVCAAAGPATKAPIAVTAKIVFHVLTRCTSF